MKKTSLFFFSAAILAMGCSHPSDNPPASVKPLFRGCPQNQVVDDFVQKGSKLSPTAVASDKGRTIWVVGNIQTSGAPDHAIVRMGIDDPKYPWRNLDDTTGPANLGAKNNGIAVNLTEHFVVVAQTVNTSTGTAANIRFTSDDGKTWRDIPIKFADNANESLSGVVLGPKDSTYFWGNSEDAAHKKTGFVVSFTDGTPKILNSTPGVEYRNLLLDGSSSLFAVGTSTDSAGTPSWYMGKAQNKPEGLSQFTSLFDPTPASGTVTSAMIDTSGLLYVGGVTDGSPYNWTVKLSTDNGKSFIDSEVYKPTHLKSAALSFLYSFGTFPIAVGTASDGNDNSYWVVRSKNNAKDPWRTVLRFKYSNDKNVAAIPTGATSIWMNQLVLVGNTYDGDHHWVTQVVGECRNPLGQ